MCCDKDLWASQWHGLNVQHQSLLTFRSTVYPEACVKWSVLDTYILLMKYIKFQWNPNKKFSVTTVEILIRFSAQWNHSGEMKTLWNHRSEKCDMICASLCAPCILWAHPFTYHTKYRTSKVESKVETPNINKYWKETPFPKGWDTFQFPSSCCILHPHL